MRKITRFLVAGFATVILLLPSLALGAEFVKPEDEGGNVVLSATEQHKNIYVAGGSVTVNSPIEGDIFVAGGTVTADSPVSGDVFAAAGTLTINNTVAGDVRVAGGTVTINGQITGDLLVAGGTVVLSEKAKVVGDVAAAAGTFTVNAPVAGKLWIAGGMITIDSKIDGVVTVRGAQQVVFGARAEIAGSVSVQAEKEPVVKDGAKVSAIDYKKLSGGLTKAQAVKGVLVGTVMMVLAYLLVALALVWFAPKRIGNFAAQTKARFWANVAVGLAGLVIVPIVVFTLFVVIIGYALALLLLALYLCALALAWALALPVVGAWLYSVITKQAHLVLDWRTAILGAVVFVLLKFIPVVGALACFVIVLACFGQLLTSAKTGFIEQGEAKE